MREVDFKIYQTVNAEYSDYLAGRSGSGRGSAGSVQDLQGIAQTSMSSALWRSATTSPTGPRAPFNNVGRPPGL